MLSGDISNHGDKQSLINAASYIFRTIGVGGDIYTGLNLQNSRVGVVPGNHDAWNAKQDGTLLDRRQKSLEHYNFAFPYHRIPSDFGCYYDWKEVSDTGIYIAYVDSCFLGDTEPNDDSTFGTIRYDQAVAKGKLSVKQTEKLLEWHDCGVKGSLSMSTDSDECIPAEIFSKALKIIVMHHYLFEPPERKSDYFMRVHHRNTVFRNIAFSDFDILMCGHKHFPACDLYSYGKHFDRRATSRYLLNYFRRIIGLHSLPSQLEDDNGHRWSKPLSTITQFLAKCFRKRKPNATPKTIGDDIAKMLKDGLDEPNSLEANLKRLLKEHSLEAIDVLEKAELKEIQKRLSVGLTKTERSELKGIAERVMKITEELKSRAFLQIMSGSTAKACLATDKERSFNTLRVSWEENKWKVVSERYLWDWDRNDFLDKPLSQTHEFTKF